MNFRYARHTNSLQPLIQFYIGIIGLEQLGEFKDHAGYDGVFIGQRHANWHLEFTTSGEPVDHHFNEDDLVVFYFDTEAEINSILSRAQKNNVKMVSPKNPYWAANGYVLADPDNFNVVLSLKTTPLVSRDELTLALRNTGIANWNEAVKYVQQLPYGRNANRSDVGLVIKEGKGTCSSKHALLKTVADLNGIENVHLILSIYKMTHANTPKTGNHIPESGIGYIPEAHCYLKLNNERIDLTLATSSFEKIAADVMTETEIEPAQVADFKVDFHKRFLRNWLSETAQKMTFDELWRIRERCIAALGE